MPIVTFSEAFPRGRGGRRGRKPGRAEGGRGRGKEGPEASAAGAQKGSEAFQGRGQSLLSGALAPAPQGTGVYAAESRQGPHRCYQDAIQAWQAKHDDAALLAEADRLAAEYHQQQSALADELHNSRQAAEEPIDLCDSDDEDMPQQPARPNRPASQNAQSAVAAAEAKRRRAEAPNQAQRPEQRQLGIRDPTPRQLSSSNALLKSLAQGSNRAQQASKKDTDWMFGGDGAYVPHASSAIDMKLRLHEIVNVFDLGLVAHPARAILDSGNASYTMITRSFAARLQLVDENGRPRQSNVRMTTVRGAVAGASEQVPLMSLSYELRGKKVHITAVVTEAKLGCDLLMSCREIAQFISEGFVFDVR